ncbi:unnamed protein product [Dovyalis caffra]|uniref:Uncharacterized protein n=1 Tax=Dovyalis caffra TaxID=77055 RepID=A0AAV1R6U0_9ROSI|nr:unnamed protein product [Dovyalis caffra]
MLRSTPEESKPALIRKKAEPAYGARRKTAFSICCRLKARTPAVRLGCFFRRTKRHFMPGWCPFSLLSDSTSELDPLPIRKCVRHSKRQDRTTSAESHPAAGIGNCGISGFRLLQRRQFIRSRILKPQTLSVNNIEKIRTKELELSSIFNSRKKILRS